MTLRLLIIFIITSLLYACQPSNKAEEQRSLSTSDLFDYTDFQLQPGDMLFQDSDCGPFCESIEKVTFGINGAKFSHVGMVIPKKSDSLIVIEAVSAGVIETSFDDFFNRSFDKDGNSKVVVGRLKSEYLHFVPTAIRYAKTKLGKAYDEGFDINNDKYYCSELLYESFREANNGVPIFELQPMTYIDPDTKETFPIWADYFKDLGIPIPEGEPGLNPGGMSKSDFIEIVHYYGQPSFSAVSTAKR